MLKKTNKNHMKKGEQETNDKSLFTNKQKKRLMSTNKAVHLERFIVCSKFNTRDITQPHWETPAKT